MCTPTSSPSCTSSTSRITSRIRSALATPAVSASETCATPTSTSRSTALTTSSMSHVSPYGFPNPSDRYATTSSPALYAISPICSSWSSASSGVCRWLRSRNVGEIEYGNPNVVTRPVFTARSAPFAFTTIPMISTSSGGSVNSSTASESAICGTAFSLTKLAASICRNPAAISVRRYSAFTSAGITLSSPCQASRGHSMIFTCSLIQTSPRQVVDHQHPRNPNHGERPHPQHLPPCQRLLAEQLKNPLRSAARSHSLRRSYSIRTNGN